MFLMQTMVSHTHISHGKIKAGIDLVILRVIEFKHLPCQKEKTPKGSRKMAQARDPLCAVSCQPSLSFSGGLKVFKRIVVPARTKTTSEFSNV